MHPSIRHSSPHAPGCKRCQTGKLYAMKVMNKRRVKAHQSEKLCWNERRILSLVDSPFVVCLKYAFTSKEDLFLILDLMRGGDLAFHLDKRGRFTMDEARYFAARTLLGLQHLHKNGIVYRYVGAVGMHANRGKGRKERRKRRAHHHPSAFNQIQQGPQARQHPDGRARQDAHFRPGPGLQGHARPRGLLWHKGMYVALRLLFLMVGVQYLSGKERD